MFACPEAAVQCRDRCWQGEEVVYPVIGSVRLVEVDKRKQSKTNRQPLDGFHWELELQWLWSGVGQQLGEVSHEWEQGLDWHSGGRDGLVACP